MQVTSPHVKYGVLTLSFMPAEVANVFLKTWPLHSRRYLATSKRRHNYKVLSQIYIKNNYKVFFVLGKEKKS